MENKAESILKDLIYNIDAAILHLNEAKSIAGKLKVKRPEGGVRPLAERPLQRGGALWYADLRELIKDGNAYTIDEMLALIQRKYPDKERKHISNFLYLNKDFVERIGPSRYRAKFAPNIGPGSRGVATPLFETHKPVTRRKKILTEQQLAERKARYRERALKAVAARKAKQLQSSISSQPSIPSVIPPTSPRLVPQEEPKREMRNPGLAHAFKKLFG